MFHSRGDRDLGVAFQTHPGSQASSCLRKGTPLASRVAQGEIDGETVETVKDGEALYSQQKQDEELTIAQIMSKAPEILTCEA